MKQFTLKLFAIILAIFGFSPVNKTLAASFTAAHDTVFVDAPLCPNAFVFNDVLVLSPVAINVNWRVIASDFPADWIPHFTVIESSMPYDNTTLDVWNGTTGSLHTSAPYPPLSSDNFSMILDMFTTTTTGTHWIEMQLTDPATLDSKNIWFVVTRVPIIYPPTPGTIIGDTSVCVASAISLWPTWSDGAWALSNANATLSGGGALVTVAGVTAGYDTLTYTRTTICGTSSTAKVIAVHPLPDAGAISGLSQVCVGDNILLTDAVPGGTWTANNSTAAVLGGLVTGAMPGIDTIIYNVINDCGTAAATKIVTVNTLPDPGMITGLSTVCAGSGITLTDTAHGGIWEATNGSATVINGSVTGISAGMDTIFYSIANSCGNIGVAVVITVNPIPSPTIVAGPPLSTSSLYSSYQWFLNGSAIPGATDATYDPLVSGLYKVMVTDINDCTGSSSAAPIAGLFVSGIDHVNNMAVYPNPVKDAFIIDLPAEREQQIAITIADISGREIMAANAVTNNPIKLDQVKAGIYILTVTTTQTTYVTKLVVN